MYEIYSTSSGQLLNIQKLVLLLDDFHLKEFKEQLTNNNAVLSLQLVNLISDEKNYEADVLDLCDNIYGKRDKITKQKFNQLSSYTFKLTSLIVRNYPNYLLPNISKIHKLVNDGELNKANFLAKIVLDVAEKIEDITTQKLVLNFRAQQSFLLKDIPDGNKLYAQLLVLDEQEKLYHEIYFRLRKNFNPFTRIDENKISVKDYKRYVSFYHNHESVSIRLVSKYAYLYLIYYFQSNHFSSQEIKSFIDETYTDIQNHAYISLPFLFDIKSNLAFFKLNSSLTDLDSKDGKAEMNQLQHYYKSIKFWNNYLNIPEVFTLTVKVSYYISKYHFKFHRKEQKQLLSEKEMIEIAGIFNRYEELLSKKYSGSNFLNDLIHIEISKSVLLLFYGMEGIKKCTKELESILTTYQQLSFSGNIDAIYVTLMCGYFSQHNYPKCLETFNRYTKLVKGKPIYEDNDITIHIYYYVAQWLLNGRKQYVKKLEELNQKTLTNILFEESRKAIHEFASYYKIPASL